MRPQVAIPMHFGVIVGNESDADRFEKGLDGRVNVTILAQE